MSSSTIHKLILYCTTDSGELRLPREVSLVVGAGWKLTVVRGRVVVRGRAEIQEDTHPNTPKSWRSEIGDSGFLAREEMVFLLHISAWSVRGFPTLDLTQ